MKGVILAGGKGKRLEPLTNVHNKQLLPMGQYPMIYHGLEKLTNLGIDDILIVTGPNTIKKMVNLLGDGDKWNINISYRIQHKPRGVAHALSLTEDFIKNDNFLVLLGDNLFRDDLNTELRDFQKNDDDVKFFLTEVESPSNYGVADFEDDELVDIQEKPTSPPSSYIVTGIYLYSPLIFDYFEKLKLSPRGEYEISSLNNHLLNNLKVSVSELKKWWIDAGTIQDYQQANYILRDKTLDSPIGKN